jgi:hypothetical protein
MEEETLNCVIGEKEMPIHDSSSEESNSSSEDSNYKINMSDKRNRKPKLGQFVNWMVKWTYRVAVAFLKFPLKKT